MTLPVPGGAVVDAVEEFGTGVELAMPRAAPGAEPDELLDWLCVWVLDCCEAERAEAEGGAWGRKAARKEERKKGRCEDGIVRDGWLGKQRCRQPGVRCVDQGKVEMAQKQAVTGVWFGNPRPLIAHKFLRRKG